MNKSIYLKCDDHAETLVFTRYDYDNYDTDFEISIEDAYCGGDFMGIKGRFKRAWNAFWAKPICYNSVCISDPERVWSFLEECKRVATANKDSLYTNTTE